MALEREASAAPVTLEEYAFVTSGMLDGLERAELLAYRDIDAERWERGLSYWDQELLSESEAHDEALAALQLKARALWQRPIPPLDTDLRAWLDFQRTVLTAPSPLAELRKIPMTLGDVVALEAMWLDRLVADRGLAEEAQRIFTEPPRPVEVPPPAPLRLPARSSAIAGPAPEPEEDLAETLPDGAPPLSVPLPGAEAAPPVTLRGAPATPAVAGSFGDSAPAPAHTPVMPPSTREWIAAPPSVGAGAPSSRSPWAARRLLDETARMTAVAEVALPFVPASNDGPPSELAPSRWAPPDSRPSLAGETVDPDEPPSAPPLPFRGVSRTEPGEPHPEDERRISLGHYAALTVELELAPHRHAELLARYALTAAAKDQLDHFFRRECERDPSLRESLAEAADAYRRWRRFL